MRKQRDDFIESRSKVLAVLIWVCFIVLFARLWTLQIVRGASNYRLSVETTTYDIAIPAPRGVFYDRNGRLLVTNRPGFNVTGLLEQLKRQPEVLTRLAGILGCDPEVIRERLEVPGIRPCQLYPVAKNVPMQVMMRIRESLDLPGIEIQEVPLRHYPHGDFATHAFGFVREISEEELKRHASSGYKMGDTIGKTGLERTLEQYLRGTDGTRTIEVDRHQRPVKIIREVDPIPGHDAWLTLDYNVQKAAEEALRSRLEYLQQHTKYRKARAGAVIAVDPRNGEILALASQPSFDPNLLVDVVSSDTYAALESDPDKPLFNRVLRGLYPPASTFKPFTVYAALAAGLTEADEVFQCDGYDKVYGAQARCWVAGTGKKHGALSLVGGLRDSCNVVMYELGRRLGVDRLARYAQEFCFGRSTGIDLAPGDANGIVPTTAFKKKLRPNEPWRELETMHFAIGQGFLEVTPIQLAMAYCALANGGNIPRPHLVREIRTLDGEVVRRFREERAMERVRIDEETRRLILAGLNEVVSGGTAAGAFAGFPLDRFPVAGKTGTGEKRGYDNFSLFACFAPADEPQIVVVVVIEQGGGGSSAAAPVARKVLEAFFDVQPAPTPAPRPAAIAPASQAAPSPRAEPETQAKPEDRPAPGIQSTPETPPEPTAAGAESEPHAESAPEPQSPAMSPPGEAEPSAPADPSTISAVEQDESGNG